MGTYSRELILVAPNDVSAAEPMTFWRIFEMMCMALLRLKFVGVFFFLRGRSVL